MRKGGKVIISVVFFILLATAAFLLYMLFLFRYHIDDPRKTVLTNSKSNEQAVLFTYGILMGQRTSLLAKNNNNFVWVGIVEADDSLGFRNIYWSMDGSVVTAKSTNRCTELPTFTHAYDFKNNKLYKPGKYGFNKKSDWLKLSKKIKDLLKSRGGIGEEFDRDSLYKTNVKVPYFEWRNLNKLEK